MFDNLSVHGMGGNVEGLFKGINQGQNELLNLSNLQTADVNRQNTLARLAMEQELHPEKVKQEGLRTVGMGYENEAKKLGNQTKSREEQEAATGTYFRYLIGGDDPEVAAAKSGVPPTFVERTRQMQSQLPPDQYQKFLDNAAKKWALSDPKEIGLAERDRRTADREDQRQKAQYRMMTDREDIITRRQLQAAQIAAEARIKAAELRVQQLLPNPGQNIVSLLTELRNAKNTPANTPEEIQARLQRMNEIQQSLDQAVAIEYQKVILQGQARQTGQPDMSQYVRTNPPPIVPGAPGIGGGTVPPQQSQAPQQQNPYGAPPPGAVRPRN